MTNKTFNKKKRLPYIYVCIFVSLVVIEACMLRVEPKRFVANMVRYYLHTLSCVLLKDRKAARFPTKFP